MGIGIIGLEIDFGYSPNFLETDSQLEGGFRLVGDGNVKKVMGNLLIGAPLGGVRPYASGGVGLIKTSVDDVGQFFEDVSESDLGLNVGAGIMGFFGDNVGIRGDIRYFRSISDTDFGDFDITLGDLDFWRGTVGVTFRF
jgi:opacity protein-like surface antigen